MSLLQRAKDSLASANDPRARPVLVVEDDAGLRGYLVAILEHGGYRVMAILAKPIAPETFEAAVHAAL